MTLQRLASTCVRLANNRVGVRSITTTPVQANWLRRLFPFFNLPTPANCEVGYEKISIEAAKVGDDPFEIAERSHYLKDNEGSGTRADPYIIYSRNTERIVIIAEKDAVGFPKHFECTLKGPNRSPIDGSHFKLVQIKGDKWGIDELDITRHHH